MQEGRQYDFFVFTPTKKAPIVSGISTLHDFKHLEEAVTALVDRYERARADIATLRTNLAARDALLNAQEEQIRDLNQKRQDAAKRLDQLIEELDRLDEELDDRSAGAAQ